MKKGLKRGFTISTNVFWGTGRDRNRHSLMQGISLLAERAGVDEWQTSRVPIVACPSCKIVIGNDGGPTMPSAIAKSTMTACHLIRHTIVILNGAVNINYNFSFCVHKRTTLSTLLPVCKTKTSHCTALCDVMAPVLEVHLAKERIINGALLIYGKIGLPMLFGKRSSIKR